MTVPLPIGGSISGSTNYTCDYDNNDCVLLVVDTFQQKIFEMSQATQLPTGELAASCLVVWDMCTFYDGNIGLRGDQCSG